MRVRQFSSVQLLSRVQLFAAPWTAAHQASLSIINFWSLLKLMSIESVMPSSHLILCRPILPLPSNFPSIRIFSGTLKPVQKAAQHGVFSSVAQLCLTLCDPIDCSTGDFSVTNSWALLKLMSIESVMPSNHLIFCHPLLLPPSIFPSIRVFSSESVLHMGWPK